MEKAIVKKQYMLGLFLLVLFNLFNLKSVVWGNLTSNESLDILAVVPNPRDSCSHLHPKWERGEEIITGAETAVKVINSILNLQNLITTYQLNIVPIQVTQCNPLMGLEEFTGNLTSRRNKIIAIVGYFCDNLVQFLSPLVGHDAFGVIQIAAMPPIISNIRNSDQTMPHFHYILPSPLVLARVAAMLMHRLGVSQIGVISSGDYHDQHYSKMTEAFLPIAQEYGISIASHITYSPRLNLTRLKQSSARVHLVFLPPSEAVDVICNTNHQGFVWPYYAWIYVELHSDEIAKSNDRCSEDMMRIAMENIILAHFNLQDNMYSYPFNVGSGTVTDNSTLTEAYMENLTKFPYQHSNIYVNVLYDSILAIVLALNQLRSHEDDLFKTELIEEELSQLSFQGATGLMNFSKNPAAIQITVGVSQVLQGELGSYDSSLNQFTFLNLSMLEGTLINKQNHVYLLYPLYLTLMLSILSVLCLVFTTATVTLFIHYRKTPQVKAASFSLSLCMFVGCYGLITSSLLHTISSSIVIEGKVLRYANCWGNTFLYTVAIDLVLATVFAKTLRIHHIFNKFGKISRLWSDKGLMVLILSIVSVKVALMVIWALVDANHLIDEISPQPQGFPPHYIVVQKCYSHHLSWWVTLVFGYSVALFIPILHVAIHTRKIHRKEFKESKAITALVAVLFVFTCIGNALWFLLRMIGANIASKVVFSLAFSSTAIVCQIFLFVLKIIPPVCILKLAKIKNRLRFKAAAVGSYTGYAYRRISQT